MESNMIDADNRSRVIVRTSFLGVGVNVLMVALKMTIGLITGSIAIILDAVNNSSDALSSIITIIGTKLAQRAPDKKYPYGHGRAEYITTVFVSMVILTAGGFSIKESLDTIISGEAAEYSFETVLPIIVAVFIKFFAGRYIIRTGKRIQAKSLVLTGRESLFDAVLSLLTIIAAVVSVTLHISIEGFLGVAIALLIIKAGAEMMFETMGTILGKRADKDITTALRKLVNSFPEVNGAYDIVLHNYGPTRNMASVHIEVDEKLTARQIHILTQNIMQEVYQQMGIMISIGIYAGNYSDPAILSMREDVLNIITAHKDIIQMHGFFVDRNNVGFDMIVDFSADAGKVREEVISELKKLHPDYNFRIVLDLDFSD